MAKKKTKKTKKVEGVFLREAAEQYAKDIGIKNPGKKDDAALAKAIAKEVGTNCDYQCPNDACKSTFPKLNAPSGGKYVRDEDVYCWCCGFDVSEDDTGGWEAYKATLEDGEEEETEDEEEAEPEDEEEAEPEEDEESESEETEEDEEPEEEAAETGSDEESESEETEEDEEPEEEAAETGSDEESESEETEEDEVPLDERVAEIQKANASTGDAAWVAGMHLQKINSDRLYKGKYKNFETFCRKAVGMSRKHAHTLMRIAKKFERDDAARLSIFKLDMLAKVGDDKARSKLLVAALPKEDGGKALDNDALKEKVAEARNTGGDTAKSPGRPAGSKFKRLVGTVVEAEHKEEKNGFTLYLDDETCLFVKTRKKGKWSIEFMEVEIEEEEEE